MVFFTLCFSPVTGIGNAADSANDGQPLTMNASRNAINGSESNFTGKVRQKSLFKPTAEAPYSVSYVTFEPGARTYWHTHPAGQRLVVMSGLGLTGTEDGKVWEIRPGDAIWCPPNVRHWHGASSNTAMTHMALTGMKDGKTVNWMEEVSEEDYNKR